MGGAYKNANGIVLQIFPGRPMFVLVSGIEKNTWLPSSAPVERLFGIGGLILTPRRRKLSNAAQDNAYVICNRG